MYNTYVEVYTDQTKNIFGNFSQSFKLVLLFSGSLDSVHYDILDFNNNNINILNKKLNFLRHGKKNVLRINQNVDEVSNFGKMSYDCKFYSAVFWQEERNKSNCYHNETIRLSPLSKYDDNLKNLLLNDNHFSNLIRYYNNLFCFATFGANFKHQQQKVIKRYT